MCVCVCDGERRVGGGRSFIPDFSVGYFHVVTQANRELFVTLRPVWFKHFPFGTHFCRLLGVAVYMHRH